jgi:alpha-1,2-mannosyltransferase
LFSDSQENEWSSGKRYRRIHPAWLLAAGWLGLVFAVTPNFRWSHDLRESPFAGDFLQEWVGARAVATGQAERLYDLAWIQRYQHDPSQVGFEWSKDQYLPMVYPPFYYLLLAPIAAIPYFWAAWSWAVVMVAGWWLATWTMLRAAVAQEGAFRLSTPVGRGSQFDWAASLPWLFTVSLLFPPLLESLISGQKGTICLAILTGTFVLLNAGRPMAAGMLYGLIAFKPQLALCIGLAMLFSRQWRFVAGALGTLAVLLTAGLGLGVGVWGEYLQWGLQSGSYAETPGYSLAKSHSLHTLFLPHTEGPLGWAQRIASWLLVGLVVNWLRRLLSGGLAFGEGHGAVQFSGLVIATVLLSPHFYTYDLTILLLPIALLSCPGVRERLPGRGAWKTAFPAAVFVAGAVGAPLAGVTGVQWTSIVLLLGLWLLTQQPRAGLVCDLRPNKKRRLAEQTKAPQPSGAGA